MLKSNLKYQEAVIVQDLLTAFLKKCLKLFASTFFTLRVYEFINNTSKTWLINSANAA